MNKRLIFAAAAVSVLLVSCSKKSEGGESASSEGTDTGGGQKNVTLRLLNNKAEIDAQLKQYSAEYAARTGIKVEIETVGGGTDPYATLKAYKASDNMPDIFLFEGPGTYKTWKDEMEMLDSEPWVNDTLVAYKEDGHVWGFPVAVEGYGLAYNAELLEKAGVDPAGLTTYGAYKEAFEKIDAQKTDLGLDAVVSMAGSISAGMSWVTGGHNFGVYLSAGLAPDDTHVIDGVLKGEVDRPRLEEYARYVKLLFDYSDKTILLNGNYDQQMQAFTDKKTAFLHQGNWADPSLGAAGATFKMSFAPHAFSDKVIDGIQVGAPSWWAVCSEGDVESAKKFIADIAGTPEGRKARVESMALISPFKSDTLTPVTPLSASVAQYMAAGKTYPWEQFRLPDGFVDTMGPIYELLARGDIDERKFCDMVEQAVKGFAQ